MSEPSPAPDPAAQRPALSVVIPSYNGGHVIGQCLAALVSQQATVPFEVIVVDSSTDGSPELIRSRFPSVRLIRFETQTPAPVQRNTGIRAAGADLIGLMDQDCLPDPGWVQGMVDAFAAHPEVSAVAGGIRPANPEARCGLANFLLEFREFLHWRPAGITRHWITCNVTVRREVFERYGYFPAHLWPGDDVIVAQAAAAGGALTWFAPKLTIAHLNRTDLAGILPHARKLGWGSAQIRRLLPQRENAWLARCPGATWLLPAAMPLRLLMALLRWSPATALRAVPLLPTMARIAACWAAGFRSGLRDPLPEPEAPSS